MTTNEQNLLNIIREYREAAFRGRRPSDALNAMAAEAIRPLLSVEPATYSVEVYRGDETQPERGGRFRVLPNGTVQFDEDGFWKNYCHASGAASWPGTATWDTMTSVLAYGTTLQRIAEMVAVDACGLDLPCEGRVPFRSCDRVVVRRIDE